MRRWIFSAVSIALFALFPWRALRAEIAVTGRVSDENGVAVPSAKVELRGPWGVSAASAGSGAACSFTVKLPVPGEYRIRAERPGFFIFNGQTELGTGPNHLQVTLNHEREFFQQVDVAYSPPTIDPEQ